MIYHDIPCLLLTIKLHLDQRQALRFSKNGSKKAPTSLLQRDHWEVRSAFPGAAGHPAIVHHVPHSNGRNEAIFGGVTKSIFRHIHLWNDVFGSWNNSNLWIRMDFNQLCQLPCGTCMKDRGQGNCPFSSTIFSAVTLRFFRGEDFKGFPHLSRSFNQASPSSPSPAFFSC